MARVKYLDSDTLSDVPDTWICLVVLITSDLLNKDATVRDATFYFENTLGQACDPCPAFEKCALCKREE